jgi:FSR family fosmidomycin resistance protein-like MFS transporter
MAAAVERKSADWNLGGLITIAFGHAVNDLFSGTIALTIFYVVVNTHVAPWHQGALAVLWYVTSSIVQPAFGAYTDRHGRWWFMPVGVTLVVVSISLASLAPSVAALAPLIVIGGLGSAIMHPEAGKYAAMLSGVRRSQGISIFQIGGSFGFALGPITIAALLAHFGNAGSLLLLVPGLLAAALVFVGIRRAHLLATGVSTSRRSTTRANTAAVDRIGIALVVGSTAVRFLTTTAFMTYLPNLIVARGGSLVEAGQLVTSFLLIGIAGMWLGGYLGDRFGAVSASVAGLTLAVPCLLGFFVAPPALGIPLLLAGSVFLAVQNAPGVVIVQSMLPKNLGMALGLINGVAFGLGSLFVTVVGVIVTHQGPQAALVDASVMPLIGAVAFVLAGRRGAAPAAQPVSG